MKHHLLKGLALTIGLLLFNTILFGQNRGLKTITKNELEYHLNLIGSQEFRGRMTPSPELEITERYLANWAAEIGLKPILPDGTYFQSIPLSVTSVFEPNTRLRVLQDGKEQVYYFNEDFGGSFNSSGSFSGKVVFVGLGVNDPKRNWNDLDDLDLYNKVVILLDTQFPDSNPDLGSTYSYRLYSRVSSIRNRGAAAVFSVISEDREASRRGGVKVFYDTPRGRMTDSFDSQRRGTPSLNTQQNAQPEQPRRPTLPFAQAEIGHDLASVLLGISKEEVTHLFELIQSGKKVPGKEIDGTEVFLQVEVRSEPAVTRNVIGMVEGSDPKLKNEFVVVCAHHDHLGINDGVVMAGADDNGTGTVALMEIAQALTVEKPKRSVIIAWFTGEEQGLYGAHYFINNCPVAAEKISTCLNMDMLGRNHTDSLYLVGSNLISTELDQAIHTVNKKFGINFGFDYLYSNLTHPQRVYFRSDQYPHVRFGIPSVWFFCGFTQDYHTPRDVVEAIDYEKFWKITKLVYLTAWDIGNHKELLKLDVNPEVITRGKHNVEIKSLYQLTRQ